MGLMSNKTNNSSNIILDLDSFDDHVSLYNIVLKNEHLQLLKSITESLQNNEFDRIYDKSPTILLVGQEGKKTVARALSNTLNYSYEEILLINFEGSVQLKSFVHPNLKESVSVFLDFQNASKFIINDVYKILVKREFEFDHPLETETQIIVINGIIVFCCDNKNLIKKTILDNIDFVIQLNPYSQDQVRKIVMQRLKFCNVGFSDEVVNLICNSCSNVRDAIRILKYGFCFMRSDCRFELNKDDVNKAIGVLKK